MPWFSPPAFQYVAWANPPGECPFCKLSDNECVCRCADCGRVMEMGTCGCHVEPDMHPESRFYYEGGRADAEDPDFDSYPYPNPGYLGPVQGTYWPSMNPLEWHPGGSHTQHGKVYRGSGRYHHHGRPPRQFHPGGGVSYRGDWHPGGGHYEANPFGLELQRDYEPPPERKWFVSNPRPVEGDFGVGFVDSPPPERDWFVRNPSHYPTPLARRVARRIARGRGTKKAIWDDVDAVLRHGKSNPEHTGYVDIWGYEVPVMESKAGKYHHVRVADPDEFTAIRTKTLSESKGIKARMGRFLGRGPRGGKTEIQSYLFDAKLYTPDDVVRWIESHDAPVPLLVEWSPVAASERRMSVRPKKKAPKKRKAKKKVAKKVAKRKKSKKKTPTRRKKTTTRRKKRAG